MPVFPGQLRYIRKNLFHAVSVIDPSTVCGLQASYSLLVSLPTAIWPNSCFLLSCYLYLFWWFYAVQIFQSIDMLISLYENNFPMRFGVVLYSSKLIKHIETSSDDSQIEEDISTSVTFFPILLLFLIQFDKFCSFTTLHWKL